MVNEPAGTDEGRKVAAVTVVTTVTGPDRYRIVATATFESAAAGVWTLLCDWERFVAVGLPGLTGSFKWLSGGPDAAPSTFQFVLAGALLKEEIYELSAEKEVEHFRLRYRTREPALGVLEYDAVLELWQIAERVTGFSATRNVRLAPGGGPEMLAAMVESETRCLAEHFSSAPA